MLIVRHRIVQRQIRAAGEPSIYNWSYHIYSALIRESSEQGNDLLRPSGQCFGQSWSSLFNRIADGNMDGMATADELWWLKGSSFFKSKRRTWKNSPVDYENAVVCDYIQVSFSDRHHGCSCLLPSVGHEQLVSLGRFKI